MSNCNRYHNTSIVIKPDISSKQILCKIRKLVQDIVYMLSDLMRYLCDTFGVIFPIVSQSIHSATSSINNTYCLCLTFWLVNSFLRWIKLLMHNYAMPELMDFSEQLWPDHYWLSPCIQMICNTFCFSPYPQALSCSLSVYLSISLSTLTVSRRLAMVQSTHSLFHKWVNIVHGLRQWR